MASVTPLLWQIFLTVGPKLGAVAKCPCPTRGLQFSGYILIKPLNFTFTVKDKILKKFKASYEGAVNKLGMKWTIHNVVTSFSDKPLSIMEQVIFTKSSIKPSTF